MKEENLNDLLEQWIVFREEELAILTNEDRKHPLHFEANEEKLLNSLPYKNRAQSKVILNKMFDNVIDYCGYYNEKYYIAGFGDCLNLVIRSLRGK